MKKILATLLAISLILTMLVIPLYAEGETADDGGTSVGADLSTVVKITDFTDEDGNDATYTDANGTVYTIISTPKQLTDGFTAAGNYILANDIDLEGATITNPMFKVEELGGSIVLEGNGYKLHNFSIDFSDTTDGYKGLILLNADKDNKCSATVNNLEIVVDGTVELARRCAILLGFDQYTALKATNVLIEASVEQQAQGVGLFAAQLNGGGTSSFKNCTAKTPASGTWDFSTSTQSAGFIGQNQAVATFDNCLVSADIKVSGQQYKAGFVGDTSSNLTFTDCSFEGSILGTSLNLTDVTTDLQHGGFLGRQNGGTTTFTGCSVEADISSYTAVGGYVGNKACGTTKFTGNCSFDGNIVGYSKSGAFLGSGTATVSEGVSLTATGTITSSKVTNIGEVASGEWTVNEYSDKNVENGELAYALAKAQADMGITDSAFVYGQTIDTDANPRPGGKTVYEIDTRHLDPFYTNDYTGIDDYDTDNGKPRLAYQEKETSDTTMDVRLLMIVSETELSQIKELDVTVSFGLTAGGTATLSFDETEAVCYYSVYAGDRVAQAAENCVMIAVTVTDVVSAEWDGTVTLTMSAADANGNPIDAYCCN